MLAIGGIVCVFVMVFGGYTLSGGKFGVILHALPFESMMIGGAAVGAFLISNSGAIMKRTMGDFSKVMKGPKWKEQDYRDLLCLLFALTRSAKNKGLVSLERHIEDPEQSPMFRQYPKIVHDHFAAHFICDTLRMMTMNFEDPHQVEDAMERQLEKHHHEALEGAHAIQTMADGLPALGIVAAVLGIIKTMSAISEPPEILGQLIGGALTGTFLGVFLAYGLVAPMASRIKQVVEEDAKFYAVIRDTLVAHLHGNAPAISIEVGRGNVPSNIQPTFYELEQATQNIPPEAFA